MSSLHLSRFRSWLLFSPPAELLITQLRELLIGALSKGPIPQHVAFIMDGNRRYARSHKIETIEGHSRGFEALARILDICYKCGVKAVTVYAFSTENFARPKYEVDGLMQLAKVKLAQLSEHGELLDRYGASIRILGERGRIPDDVLEVCDRAVEMTSGNTDAILNICFPYTSREEITAAIRSTVTEYSTPPQPQTTPFSQSRISQKIRSSKSLNSPSTLEAVSEASTPPSEAGDMETAEPLPQAQESGSSESLGLGSGSREVNSDMLPPPPSLSSLERDISSESSASSSSASSSHSEEADHDDSVSTSTTLYPDYSSSPPKFHPSSTHPFSSHLKAPKRSSSSSSLQSHSHPPSSTSLHPSSKTSQQPQIVNNPETITPSTLSSHLYTSPCPPLDLLVRTSGVTRLSDFMLWQCHEDTHISFLDCLWPEFDLWQFIPVLLEWQWRKKQGGRERERAGGLRDGKGASVGGNGGHSNTENGNGTNKKKNTVITGGAEMVPPPPPTSTGTGSSEKEKAVRRRNVAGKATIA
ncbi:Decaprenyl diphosphate synthase-like protein [Zalerion maritima]|uniref:Decaprenyl diphosphate synthase-like protein n=1 Tax=Zalerion maritima TaxID=339359 RepID=A0AAD5WTB0_9PEZI|nr:Decaprenyl diphosphate synthase-like protein [Zalerion maritima]